MKHVEHPYWHVVICNHKWYEAGNRWIHDYTKLMYETLNFTIYDVYSFDMIL